MDKIQILAVDKAYTPDRWLTSKEAFGLIARGLVQTTLGETAMTLRGGTNAHTGKQSIMELGSILVVDTKDWVVNDFNYAPLDSDLLFARDKHMCAYCGDIFKKHILTMDHVKPASSGGATSWTNLVTACGGCNQRKANRTPQKAGMELLYVPYRPNRFEWLILANRHLLADQMEFLMSRVPKHSRLLS